jgi:PIN domain nuclease of toxin-antitoxin system
VKALLDTHTFIWWTSNDPALTIVAKNAIEDGSNEIFLSAVSTWEMAIKISLGKLTLAGPLQPLVLSHTAQYLLKPLSITYDHTYIVETLPLHHKDPFDRLLIAQAMVENLVILTCDSEFAKYGVPILW